MSLNVGILKSKISTVDYVLKSECVLKNGQSLYVINGKNEWILIHVHTCTCITILLITDPYRYPEPEPEMTLTLALTLKLILQLHDTVYV